jgi:hypothetical protein
VVPKHLKHVAVVTTGGILLVAGIALLVLPGPGMLLVLAGLVVLSNSFPRLERHVEPVRRLALQGMRESVSSPLRIAGSVLAGLALIAAGIVWGLVPALPFSGWPTGSGLILSGLILLGLLGYSYRNVTRERAAQSA